MGMMEELASVRRRLREARAGGLKALQRLAKQLARRYHRHDEELGPILTLAELLWWGGVHEERMLAVHMLSTLERLLAPEHWNIFKEWMDSVHSRETCDGVAGHLLGSIVTRDRTFVRVLRYWALSDNVWIRRAAAMGILLRTRQMSDIDAALSVCEPLMRDPTPEVQEAVGRVLYEARQLDPEMTDDFLDRWMGKAPDQILALARGA
jgi:3-methyladenine DNA glycosylase AlkD